MSLVLALGLSNEFALSWVFSLDSSSSLWEYLTFCLSNSLISSMLLLNTTLSLYISCESISTVFRFDSLSMIISFFSSSAFSNLSLTLYSCSDFSSFNIWHLSSSWLSKTTFTSYYCLILICSWYDYKFYWLLMLLRFFCYRSCSC